MARKEINKKLAGGGAKKVLEVRRSGTQINKSQKKQVDFEMFTQERHSGENGMWCGKEFQRWRLQTENRLI